MMLVYKTLTLFITILLSMAVYAISLAIAKRNASCMSIVFIITAPFLFLAAAVPLINLMPAHLTGDEIFLLGFGSIGLFFVLALVGRHSGINKYYATPISRAIRSSHQPREVLIEQGANLPCVHCHLPQRNNRLEKCSQCGGLYCRFPLWRGNLRSDFEIFISNFMCLNLTVLFILTAISIGGALIVYAPFFIGYHLIRILLPNFPAPPYWKNCGSNHLCNNCKPAPESADPERWDGNSRDTDNYLDDRRERDEDDDGPSDRSFWDGWLVKW